MSENNPVIGRRDAALFAEVKYFIQRNCLQPINGAYDSFTVTLSMQYKVFPL